MLASPDTEATELAERIHEVCPEAGQCLLDRANSPEFALQKQIKRVEHAIAMLGNSRAVQSLEMARRQHRQQMKTSQQRTPRRSPAAPPAPHFLNAPDAVPATQNPLPQ